jgi:hypothetical protein
VSLFSPDTIAVVAGNGPSLAHIAPGRVTGADTILRTNSFFLEPVYYLGTRVDLAMISGDPRVAPFIAETLRRHQGSYDLRHWSATNPAVGRKLRRRMLCPYQPMHYATPDVAAAVARFCAQYQAQPTAGVQTMFLAHALGARHILLAGIDLYATPQRYAFDPGPRMQALMGRDLGTRTYDSHLHHPDLDRALIGWLASQPDVVLHRAADPSPLTGLLDLAPVREGPALEQPVKAPITDWSGSANGYPIGLLMALRKVRGVQRMLWRKLRG